MKIGIIGAGQIGSTLTKRFTAAEHQVFVSNSRGPESLAKLAQETGAMIPGASSAVLLCTRPISTPKVCAAPWLRRAPNASRIGELRQRVQGPTQSLRSSEGGPSAGSGM